MSTYSEDHLVEQPAIQLMRHELGWETAREEILNVGFSILNGRGRRMSGLAAIFRYLRWFHRAVK